MKILTENIDEYMYMLRHMCRFMKELGMYRQFMEITIRYYGTPEDHFKAISHYYSKTKDYAQGWMDFFSYIPYLGENFRDYNAPPKRGELQCTGSLILFMGQEWRKYIWENNVHKKFSMFRKSKKKTLGPKKVIYKRSQKYMRLRHPLSRQ